MAFSVDCDNVQELFVYLSEHICSVGILNIL